MDPLTLAQTKLACRALARLMVPEEATWADADVMLLAYRQQALRRASSTDGGTQTRPAARRRSARSSSSSTSRRRS
jgi:hypothetical protein